MSPLIEDSTDDPSQQPTRVENFSRSQAMDVLVEISYEGEDPPDDEEAGRLLRDADSLMTRLYDAELLTLILRHIGNRYTRQSNTAEMFKALFDMLARRDRVDLIMELRDFMPPGWKMGFPNPNEVGGLRLVRVKVPPSDFEVFAQFGGLT